MGNPKLGVLKATGDTETWKWFVIEHPKDVNPVLPKAVEFSRGAEWYNNRSMTMLCSPGLSKEEDTTLFPQVVEFNRVKSQGDLNPLHRGCSKACNTVSDLCHTPH